jgi:predicted N-acetyltransferase YhbS
VPDEVFMVMELRENALQGVEGIVQYSSAFAE